MSMDVGFVVYGSSSLFTVYGGETQPWGFSYYLLYIRWLILFNKRKKPKILFVDVGMLTNHVKSGVFLFFFFF